MRGPPLGQVHLYWTVVNTKSTEGVPSGSSHIQKWKPLSRNLPLPSKFGLRSCDREPRILQRSLHFPSPAEEVNQAADVGTKLQDRTQVNKSC
ncbi:hypothetical protein NQ317_015923 [Molorchus minor]|uniref:Uncharacterized protein n=1 Tax=Molorchus minor TaxID=1323400 RepID=A0ABQ9JKG8_9CUCU|nr:hypothetical protein NQ317_015923 [Molorchus minor]